MDQVKRVITADDIVFEKENITIKKGQIFVIGEVVDQGIVLIAEDEEKYLMDFASFESGFEIYVGDEG